MPDGKEPYSLIHFLSALVDKVFIEVINLPFGNPHRLIYKITLSEGFSNVVHGYDACRSQIQVFVIHNVEAPIPESLTRAQMHQHLRPMRFIYKRRSPSFCRGPGMYRPAHHVVHAYAIGLNEVYGPPCSNDKRLANNAVLNELVAEYLGRYRGQIFQVEMVHAEPPLTRSGSELRGYWYSVYRCPFR